VHRSDLDLLETKVLEAECSLFKAKAGTDAVDLFKFEKSSNTLWLFQLKYSDQKLKDSDGKDKKDRSHTKAIPELIHAAEILRANPRFATGCLHSSLSAMGSSYSLLFQQQ
jgi:hypothetical protein